METIPLTVAVEARVMRGGKGAEVGLIQVMEELRPEPAKM